MIRSLKPAVLVLLAVLAARTAAAQGTPAPDPSPARQNVFYGQTPAAAPEGPVILFVHGINGVASDWWAPANNMYALAYAAGYRTAFVSLSEDNTRNNADVSPNGTMVHQVLPAVLNRFHASRLYIVAHSKGGVDVQAALLDASTSLLVRAVFTVGTPHQGTELADWAFGAGKAQAAPLGLLTPAVAALTTPRMQLFRQVADQASFLNGVPYYTISGNSYTAPPATALTSTTGPVLSALTGGLPNDGVVIVPRTKLPAVYSTDLGAIPANHFTLALGTAIFGRINAQIRAIEGSRDFKVIATKGFSFDGTGAPLGGDRQNSFPWSMHWFKGKLYVGTGRAFSCVTVQTNDVALGRHDYPGTDPDVECTEDPTDLPLAAEVWRFTPETGVWERVYQSPVDVPIEFDAAGKPTKFTARDIAFRGMTTFKENTSGVERMYIGGISASSLYDQLPGYGPGGRRFPAPRILWTEDGSSWHAVPQTPGTFLGDIGIQTEVVNKRGFRSFVTLPDSKGVNRLFVTVSDLRGVGRVIASSNPSAGDNAWRQVSPSADVLPIFTLYVYRNEIYATVGDTTYAGGYAVFKTNASTPDPTNPTRYLFTPVVQGDGMQLLRPRGAISMQEFQGRLYVGTDRPPELIRINPDGSWDLIVGPPRMTSAGFKWPLSGILGKGFNSLTNGHFYSMTVHDGTLYLGTWDWAQILQYTSLNPFFKSSYGFDLFKSRDGVHWSVIDRTGLGDPYNASVRNLVSTPFGLFLGATNTQFGLQVLRNTASLDLNKDGVIDSRDVNLIVAARNAKVPAGTFDARDLDGDGVVTVNDSRKLATQCTLPACALAPATKVAGVTDLKETTDFAPGPRVHLAWTAVPGAVRYHVYRADAVGLNAVIPPSTVVPLPDGTSVTVQQIEDGVLNAVCSDPTTPEDSQLCAYVEAFISGTTMSTSFHWLGSASTPGYVDAAPPASGQTLYYVAVEDATGRISEPSNTVAGPDEPGAPVVAQLGDRILQLRASLGEAGTAALGRQVSLLAGAIAEYRLSDAVQAATAIDQRLAGLPAAGQARLVVASVTRTLAAATDHRLGRAAVQTTLIGSSDDTGSAATAAQPDKDRQ